MPELPEVETIVRALRNGGRGDPPILGRTVSQADIFWPRTLASPDIDQFRQRLPGQTVVDVDRRAKLIVIRLERDTLLIHLRMSGDLRVEPETGTDGQPVPLKLHDHAVVHFTDGFRLVFNDARKFGRIWLCVDAGEVTALLGPEPLDPGFTPAEFHRRLVSRRRQIKPLLLDQAFLSGLGNIYTDEALFLAGLHPASLSDRLSPQDSERLLGSIRQVLNEGIDANGASLDWVYRGGDFQNRFRVYQRTGQACFNCGRPIERILIGQRSTHFCLNCQTLLD